MVRPYVISGAGRRVHPSLGASQKGLPMDSADIPSSDDDLDDPSSSSFGSSEIQSRRSRAVPQYLSSLPVSAVHRMYSWQAGAEATLGAGSS